MSEEEVDVTIGPATSSNAVKETPRTMIMQLTEGMNSSSNDSINTTANTSANTTLNTTSNNRKSLARKAMNNNISRLEKATPRTLIRGITHTANDEDESMLSETSINSSVVHRVAQKKSNRGKGTPRTQIRAMTRNVSDVEDSTMLEDSRVNKSKLSHNSSTFSSILGSASNNASFNLSTASTATTKGNISSISDVSLVIPKEQTAEQQDFMNITQQNSSAIMGIIEQQQQQQRRKPQLPKKSVKRRQARTLSQVLPNATVKHFVEMSSSKIKFSQAALEVVGESLDAFVGDFAESLRRTAKEQGRTTVSVKDVEIQMLRQGLISSSLELRQLIHKHLPMEYVEHLLPSATVSNKLHPSCKKAKLSI
eukprot:m.10521 g.10521  ORF g.10521 m.10521 type:complete len:367 (-) comp6636_c0_seq1:159-1259(-)